MTKKILTIAFVGLMSFGMTSCKIFGGKDKNETTMIKDFSLEGSEWKLESIGERKFVKPGQMRSEFISLKFEDGYVGTSDGCNGMSGEYTQTGDQLTFGPFRSTKMFCDWELFNVPFYEIKSFRTDGKQLEMLNENQEVVATYSKL